jgi:tetratricopeptide (TPR) repeat protein
MKSCRSVLVLLCCFLAECPGSFAEDDDPNSLDQQVLTLYQQGKYQEAIPIAEKLLEIRKKELGLQDADTANCISDLAALYDEMGDYAKAEALYQQALQIRQKVLGPDHPDTALSFNNLGVLYAHTGNYAKAEPLYQQAIEIRRKLLGENHPLTAASLNSLGVLYYRMGDYTRAEPLFKEALQIRQKVLGPEHPDTAAGLNDLAGMYLDAGDYAKAEPLLRQTLEIRKKALGPEHPETAASLSNLAVLYEAMGDHTKAEPLYQQALQIRQKVLGPEHPDTAISFNNLALLYERMGDYAKAEPCFQEALRIRQKVLGPEHPLTAQSINNLAFFCARNGDYRKAELLYQEALRIKQKVLGPEHPSTALSLTNLAIVYEHMGDYLKAERLGQQALEINSKSLGPTHPHTATALGNLALVKFELGKTLEAQSLARLSAKAKLTVLANVLSFASEQQRLDYQDTLNPYIILALLKGTEADLAEAILHYKGIVLDSIIEDRLVAEASKGHEDHDMIRRLAGDKSQLGQLLLRTPNNASTEADEKIADLEREVDEIEGRLAQHVSGLGVTRRALSVSVEQVQRVIPKDAALIEFVRYSLYLGNGNSEPRYGAILLASNGQPAWIPLGNVGAVNKLVSRYQRLVRDPSDEAELLANLEKLYLELWAPVERSLPSGVKRVIISPDAQLNFVSFATLVDSNEHFLAETYSVQYVASGRDLLREITPTTRNEAIVFANPDFNLDSSQTIAQADHESSSAIPSVVRGNEKRDLEDLFFSSLKGTQTECDKLGKAFAAWSWNTVSFTDKDATKEALFRIHSPYILHLATHGFFESEDQTDATESGLRLVTEERSAFKSKFFKNPMHRSGLALAGAQTTLRAWKRADSSLPAIENDGIVTAEDVAALDLKGTWLVTLSACDTGSGEAKAGEGVMGLRRGFMEAGTQNLLMTLWPISDETTVEIMTDFYDHARNSSNAPQALAVVQRDWLVKLRKERGLAEAVSLAGPFIMSCQGKP